MLSTIQDLQTRRSVRKFKDEQISEELLAQILDAGKNAPSGMGKQSAIMVVLQDKEAIAKVSKMNAAVMGRDGDPFYGAPTVVVVLADRSWGTAKEDGCLVMGNLLNAAYAAGLGGCWVNRAYEVFETEEGKALLKSWGIEGDYFGIGNCILGVPDDAPAAKPWKENYVYRV